MRSIRRRLGAVIALGAVVLLALPGVVSADCTGIGCGPPGPAELPVDGLEAVVFLVIIVVFGTVMAVAEVRRR